MRKWIRIFLTLLLAVGLHAPAWANSELHPGGRLFFPLWDVSTANRETFIILTREAMREGANIQRVENQWHISGDPGKCLPRGANGSETNVNRTDLDGTAANPVFVDDVFLQYYGRTCIHANERIHMSCGDVDLILLSSTDPRPSGFANVAADRRGALDVSFVTNGQIDRMQRKLENSLMGEAIISDLAEGWVAGYAAASAKAVPCPQCSLMDSGTEVGYENYPMEVYLPYAFADQFSLQGPLSNLLALWSPNLLPGGPLSAGFRSSVIIKYWDGRERPFLASTSFHALIRTLGDPIQAFQDTPSSVIPNFNVSNFTCGHTAGTGTLPYENDGFPRLARKGGGAVGCDGPAAPDPEHKSDNFEVGPRIQPSTPIAWWRFQLVRDNDPPFPLSEDPDQNYDHSGRGLVGVVLTSPLHPPLKRAVGPVEPRPSIPHGPADATRLWHEDPCEIAQSGDTIGPPHERDFLILDFLEAGNGSEFVALFNALNFDGEKFLCAIGRP